MARYNIPLNQHRALYENERDFEKVQALAHGVGLEKIFSPIKSEDMPSWETIKADIHTMRKWYGLE